LSREHRSSTCSYAAHGPPDSSIIVDGFEARVATPSVVDEERGVWRSSWAVAPVSVLAQRQHEGRYLRTMTDDDGMRVIQGRLPPEVRAVLLQALERAEAVVSAESCMPGEHPLGMKLFPLVAVR